ncbi:MAG: hypothetical protein VW405_01065 [Rhodospirillaceae bacterium]
MPAQRLTPAQLQEAVDSVDQHGSLGQAARALGMPEATLQARHRRAVDEGYAPMPSAAFEVPPLPDELPSADELLRRREQEFERRKAAKDARKLIDVAVRLDGPVGIAILGDPHVDDPGTDIKLLREHVTLFQKHDALLPIGIGDYQNNWLGRLSHLWGEQSTSAAEALVLVEWLVSSTRWLALVGGNHDAWSGAGDPLQWMARSARAVYEAHGVRLGLTLPGGQQLRVNARHNFSGNSMWNPAHGVGRAAQMGFGGDHVLVAGHTHTSGIMVLRDHQSGRISHALRIGSYKTYDRYAEEKGFQNNTFMVCPVVVVRPRFSDDDNRFLTTFFEPGTAAEFLQWLRRRKSE